MTVSSNGIRSANGTKDVSISFLAKKISHLSEQLSSYLSATSQPEPNFSVSLATVPETPEYEALRAPLNDAANDLIRLVNGPKSTLRSFFFSHYDLAALQIALDRRFFNHVPLPSEATVGDGSKKQKIVQRGASAAEVAEKAGMDEDRTARVLKFLATHRIFEEVVGDRDRFQHTAMSALFARDEPWNATADMQMDDLLKAASESSTQIAVSPHSSDSTNCAFSTRFGMSMYKYYEENPEKGTRFAKAMSSWSQLDRAVAELRDSFSWESLKKGKVVDIGGGSGHISIALARQYPLLSFVVQDISTHMLAQAQGPAIQDLEGRITFQQHDFFAPQPVYDADAYLLRQCLHNYNDADSMKILRALVPALERCKPGTPLLINDVILPENGAVTRFEEHYVRQLDFTMMVALGAKQRSEREFNTILKEVDSRFKIVNVYTNALGVGLLEVHLSAS